MKEIGHDVVFVQLEPEVPRWQRRWAEALAQSLPSLALVVVVRVHGVCVEVLRHMVLVSHEKQVRSDAPIVFEVEGIQSIGACHRIEVLVSL